MKLHIFVLGGLLCLGSLAAAQTSNSQSADQKKSTQQSANRMKRPPAAAPMTTGQSITGCVDQQGDRYVIRDQQTDRLITLSPAGANADDQFARFVGHQAQVSGSLTSDTLTVSQIGQVADMCPIGK
jgi:hypothetical protein